jgi:hypothetical protein
VRLFILFDRAAALGQPAPLKFNPRTVWNCDDADWAKPEAIALGQILDVLAPEFALDRASETLGDVGTGQISPLDEK